MSRLSISAIGLIIATILSKILGFGRELTLSYFYGTGMQSEAYITALNIPGVLFACIGVAISTSFIPLYSGIKENEGELKANLFTSNLINIVMILVGLITVFGIIFSREIVHIFAIGFTGEKLELTINFAKILFLGSIFLEISNIVSSYLQIKGNYIIPGIIAIPYNIIIMGSIILSAKFNNYIIVYGTVFAMLIQVAIQLPFMYKHGFRYKTYIKIRDNHIKEMMYLVAPVFVGVAVNQVNALVDKTLASTLSSGSIAALNYANKLNGFILALFVMSISTIVYPLFSKYISKNKTDEFGKLINTIINLMLLVLIPTSIGAMVLSEPIVKLLFERGAFGSNSTIVTSGALFFYSIGIIGFGLREILVRAFYSLKDTKTPMINGVISVVLNIILNISLIKFMGVNGLALATSLSSILAVCLLINSLNKRMNVIKIKKLIILLIKSLGASAFMGIVVKVIYSLTINYIGEGFIGLVISIGGSVVVGIIIYLIIICNINVDETNLVINKVRTIIQSKRS